jgi:hypothetical protein
LIFISKRKLFQELFENVFEVLEEKKEKIFSFSASGPKPASLLFLGPVAFFFPCALLFLAVGRVAGRPSTQPRVCRALLPLFSG